MAVYPYEPGAVGSSYDYHLPKYENGDMSICL